MSHVQTQILSRVLSRLTGLATTGSRVFQGRVHPLTPASMPGLCVSLGGESPTGGTTKATLKEVSVMVDVYVAGDDYAVSGQVQVEVEAALYGDRAGGLFFNGLATNLVYGGDSRAFVDSAALKHTKVSITYNAEYQTVDGVANAAN
jgi:hypothetical protein